MKPPRFVKVGPYRYRIEFTAEELENSSYAECDLKKEVIRVRMTLSEGITRDTILHEIMHAVWDAFSVMTKTDHLEDVEEHVIRHLSTGVLGVLRDNPRLVAYLTEKEAL